MLCVIFTDYALGVDTALNVIKSALDDIRDTSSSINKAFVVETMGRDCGYLAAISAITSGAEICVIPELKTDFDLTHEQQLYTVERIIDGWRKIG